MSRKGLSDSLLRGQEPEFNSRRVNHFVLIADTKSGRLALAP
jgi:hypothetical protein